MSDKSRISWCSATWNFLTGCTPAGADCQKCYAARDTHNRLANNPNPLTAGKYAGLTVIRGLGDQARPVFNGTIRFTESVLDQPIRWKRPRKIFVNSYSDLWHPDVKWEWLDRAYAVMAMADHHIYQILTKRGDGMADYLNHPETPARIQSEMRERKATPAQMEAFSWPLPHVWHGVSVGLAEGIPRIEGLRRATSAVKFLSIEPLIGPVDLTPTDLAGIDWMIVGGESGPNARPMHPVWAIRLLYACRTASVRFFFKQWGEYHPNPLLAAHPKSVSSVLVYLNGDSGPETVMYRVGRRRLENLEESDLLNGARYHEFPGAPQEEPEASAVENA